MPIRSPRQLLAWIDVGGRPTYRVIAMRLVATGERELREAGAEGFRISVVPNHEQEGVFVLHRTPGTAGRFDYKIVRLKQKTAG